MITSAVIILGHTLTWTYANERPCEYWAATVEALAAVTPEHRLGTAQQWARHRPDRQELFRLALEFVQTHGVTQQNGYTLAYRNCAI